MTKFSTVNKKNKMKTVFTKRVSSDIEICDTNSNSNSPDDFDNVVLLESDVYYGDVFKAYNDGDEENFILFFGVAGNEFNQ